MIRVFPLMLLLPKNEKDFIGAHSAPDPFLMTPGTILGCFRTK